LILPQVERAALGADVASHIPTNIFSDEPELSLSLCFQVVQVKKAYGSADRQLEISKKRSTRR